MTWKEPEKWSGLVSGSCCPMCEDAHKDENDFSLLIAELPFSYLRLPRNQSPKGWVSLIFKRHVTELYQMTPNELNGFWADVAAASLAVSAEFNPVKLFYGVFGSIVPHVHAHVLPKYSEDDPHAPITMGKPECFVAPNLLMERVARVREHLATNKP